MSDRRLSIRGLWMQIARTSGARMYWMGASFVSTIITARYLGPAGRGVVAAATGWVAMFAMLAGLSVSQAIVFVSAGKRVDRWLPQTFTGTAAILAAATLAGWCAAAAGLVVRGGALFNHLTLPVVAIAFATLPLILWNDAANSLMIATGSLDRLNAWQVGGATCSLAGVAVLVAWLGWGVYGALFAAAISPAIVAGGTIAHLSRRARPFLVEGPTIRTLIGSGLRMHVNTVATFTVIQANVLLVNAFLPAAETGYYQLAVQLISAIQMLPLAVSYTAVGIVTREGADRAWPHQKRLLLQSTALAAGLAVAGWLGAPLAVRIVGGARFLPTVPIFRILLLGLVGMNFGTVMGSQWVARGWFFRLTAISAVTGALSLAANYYVVPRYGTVGSAWVTAAVYTAAFIPNGAMAIWVELRSRRASAAEQTR